MRILRLITYSTKLQKNIDSIIKTIPNLAKPITALLLILMFYALWGLFLFSGVEEYRCRASFDIINNSYSSPIGNSLCGGIYDCEEG